MAQLKFEFLFGDKKQRMAQSHDELIANIVLNYSKPQKVYMLNHMCIQTKDMGFFDSMMKIMFTNDVVICMGEIEDYPSPNNITNRILAYFDTNVNLEDFPDNTWKLLMAEALETNTYKYGALRKKQYVLYEFDYETNSNSIVSKKKLIKLLRQ